MSERIWGDFSGDVVGKAGLGSISAALAALATNSVVRAQMPAEEIVVTAERRPTAIRDTPTAITVLDQQFIARHKLDDVKALIDFTPGFTGNSNDSFIDGIAIRGIVSNDYGVGGDPSIGIFKDGIYQGRSGSAVTSLFDVERAEALRGPQGFLFGRNAISGAIDVVTRKPEIGSTGGHLYLGLGETARREGEAAINLAAGPDWAFRFAGYHVANRGWIDNLFTPGRNDRLMGQDKWAGRAAVAYERGPLKIVLQGEYERRHLDATPYRAADADREVFDRIDAALGTHLVIGGGPRDVNSDLLAPRDVGRVWGTTLRADLQLGAATLTSLTGYRRHRFFYSEDYDGTPLLLGDDFQRQRGSYASQEFRLASAANGRVSWSIGVAGYREKIAATYDNVADERAVCLAGYGYASCEDLTRDLFGTDYSPAPGGLLDDRNSARSINTGLSLVGDLNVRPIPALQIGAGLRYAWDHRRFGIDVAPSASSLGNIWTFTYFTNGWLAAARTWQGATPRIFLLADLSDRLSLYASVTRGYKAGGFGSFTVDAPAPVDGFGPVPPGTRPDDFAPETIWSEEAGVKGELFERRLRFDVTAFHYLYRNLQTVYFDPNSRTQQVINIGRVLGYGIESTASFRLGRYLDGYATLTYTRTIKRGDRDCAVADCGGLPNPTWASSGAVTAHHPFAAREAYLTGEWIYEGKARPSFDARQITRRKGYVQTNLRAGVRLAGRWEVEAYVQNLFDATFYRGAYDNGVLTPSNWWGVSQPRNVGVNLRCWFGRGAT